MTWAPAWAPLVVAGLAAAGLYGSAIAGLATQWATDENSSHGLLLAGAAAFVLYRRWRWLRSLPLNPANSGFLVLAFALIVYAAGTITGDVFVVRVSMPFAVAGCVLALCGRAHARSLAAPIGLVLIAIPLPMVIVTHLTLPLQLVASQVAAETLDAAGIFVVREGNLLMLRDITLEVAEACSGLRSLVSLVTVGAVCAAVLGLSAGRGLMLMAVAVPIAVIGNGFRVAATGFLTTWFGEVAVRGLMHDLTGYAAFLVMCTAVIGVQVATRHRSRGPQPAASSLAVSS